MRNECKCSCGDDCMFPTVNPSPCAIRPLHILDRWKHTFVWEQTSDGSQLEISGTYRPNKSIRLFFPDTNVFQLLLDEQEVRTPHTDMGLNDACYRDVWSAKTAIDDARKYALLLKLKARYADLANKTDYQLWCEFYGAYDPDTIYDDVMLERMT